MVLDCFRIFKLLNILTWIKKNNKHYLNYQFLHKNKCFISILFYDLKPKTNHKKRFITIMKSIE